MKKDIKLPDEIITSKIYFIRNQKVMLDRDLAKLYGVETKVLKQAVRRNLNRFPKDFMFMLNLKEFNILRSQFVTSNWGGTRYVPMVFTEQGVAMLSSVLKSQTAILINIQIIRVFTKIRTAINDNLTIKLEVEEIKKKLSNQHKNIELIFLHLDELLKKQKKDSQTSPSKRQKIGYKK